jgi:hypothetical protein
VRAAKWNSDCEIGAVWLRRIVRRGNDGQALVISGPTRHVVYPMLADDTPGTPVLDYPGVLAVDQKSVEFRVDEAQTADLVAGIYRHKIIVESPELDGPDVLARGYFTVHGDGSDL